jgi:hypothetical protein
VELVDLVFFGEYDAFNNLGRAHLCGWYIALEQPEKEEVPGFPRIFFEHDVVLLPFDEGIVINQLCEYWRASFEEVCLDHEWILCSIFDVDIEQDDRWFSKS